MLLKHLKTWLFIFIFEHTCFLLFGGIGQFFISNSDSSRKITSGSIVFAKWSKKLKMAGSGLSYSFRLPCTVPRRWWEGLEKWTEFKAGTILPFCLMSNHQFAHTIINRSHLEEGKNENMRITDSSPRLQAILELLGIPWGSGVPVRAPG